MNWADILAGTGALLVVVLGLIFQPLAKSLGDYLSVLMDLQKIKRVVANHDLLAKVAQTGVVVGEQVKKNGGTNEAAFAAGTNYVSDFLTAHSMNNLVVVAAPTVDAAVNIAHNGGSIDEFPKEATHAPPN